MFEKNFRLEKKSARKENEIIYPFICIAYHLPAGVNMNRREQEESYMLQKYMEFT